MQQQLPGSRDQSKPKEKGFLNIHPLHNYQHTQEAAVQIKQIRSKFTQFRFSLESEFSIDGAAGVHWSAASGSAITSCSRWARLFCISSFSCSVSIGGCMCRKTLLGCRYPGPSNMLKLFRTVTGIMVAFDRRASFRLPGLKLPIFTERLRVPSGKMHTGCPPFIRSTPLRIACTAECGLFRLINTHPMANSQKLRKGIHASSRLAINPAITGM